MHRPAMLIFILGISMGVCAQTDVNTNQSSMETEEPQLGSDLEGRDPGVPIDANPQEREEDRDAGVRGGTGIGEGAGTGLSGGVGTGSGMAPN